MKQFFLVAAKTALAFFACDKQRGQMVADAPIQVGAGQSHIGLPMDMAYWVANVLMPRSIQPY